MLKMIVFNIFLLLQFFWFDYFLNAAEMFKEMELSVSKENCEIKALLKVGTQKHGITITLLYEDGIKTIINAYSGGIGEQTDAFIEFPEFKIKYFVKPNLKFYELGDRKQEILKNWEQLPGASEVFFPFVIKKINNSRIEFWINGSYVGFNERNARLKKIVFKTNGDAEIKEYKCETRIVDSIFLPLDITTHNNPGIMKSVKLPFKSGITYINGVPFIIGNGENFDLGNVKNYSKTHYEIDLYLSRTPFDGLPEFLHYSVPLDQYIRAYVLCAVEDTADKEPVFTARLTRYHIQGRGDAIADTTVYLTEGNLKENIKKSGAITYFDKGGREKKVPLYFVEVFLKVGEIQDLVYNMGGNYFNGMLSQPDYLDFEILGKTGPLTCQWDFTRKPANDVKSGVHIFAITLERTPIMIKILPAQIGNIYEKREKPEMFVNLFPKKNAEKYTLAWEIHDLDGNLVSQNKKEIFCENIKTETLIVPLHVKDNGWYSIKISLFDSKIRLLIEHPASFAILPDDTRKSSYESPFGTWWFGGAHLGTEDPEIAGPLFLKAGLRHSIFSEAWHRNLSEQSMAKWKVTSFQVPWWRGWKPEADVEIQCKNYEDWVRSYLEKWPNCKYALVFHESYGGNTIPPELYDAKPQPADEKRNKEIERLISIASMATRVLRETFPEIKIVFGNCNSVSDLVAEFFRRGYPRENIDYFGIEAAGQTWMPEKLIEYGTQAAWFVRETGRKFGYEIPVTSCYEWIYRQERVLGSKTLAEWYVRDALIALAYRFPTISLGLLYDVGNCYYQTLWGGSGFLKRYPLLYPKPSYVAISNLTRIMDGAMFICRVPTNSFTLYALEFKRDTQFIYAIWVPRGNCETKIRFEKDGEVDVEDLYGRKKLFQLKNYELKLDARTDVQYIISDSPVLEISAGKRNFSENKAFEKAKVVNRMDNLSEWEILKEKDDRLEVQQRGYLPLRTLGNYIIREVKDSERGKCLELELIPNNKLADILNEYTILRLKNPVIIKGDPTTIGVWVKGNSSWGRVMFEIEDAEGKTFLSCGTGGWGCDIHDWPSIASINFDGWCFIQFPITKASPLDYDKMVPGGVSGQWVVTGGKKREVIYPIKIKGIAIEMSKKTLDLTEMVPVKNLKIRLSNLSYY
ncbi:MAG: hypothetical protein NC827_05070 [Candidatus Omnitrophica bacterium]|nr:hypothetical protein [Candidatus Omnitrophota bacterium]